VNSGKWAGRRWAKLLFVFLALVFALSCLGQAGAYWREGLTVAGVGIPKRFKPRPVPFAPAGKKDEEKNAQPPAPEIILENNGPVQETGAVLKKEDQVSAPVLEESNNPVAPAGNVPPVLEAGPGGGERTVGAVVYGFAEETAFR